MGRLRVFLIDDQLLVRAGFKALVSDHPEMELINNQVLDTDAVLDEIAATGPDVVVVDVPDSGARGVELTARVRACCPSARIVVLGPHEDQEIVQALLQAGAIRYVPSRATAEDLIRAIKFAAESEVAHPSAETPNPELPATEGRNQLSERETQVLQLIAEGHSNKEIAAQLAVSAKTVETYKLRLMEKLNLRTRVDIVRYALQQGLLR
jgi:DNA-binding NarL/FixJ family response regulator